MCTIRYEIKYLINITNIIDIDDVNKALNEVHEEVENKVANKEFRDALNEQNSINEAICAENCVARWLWKSGDLNNGYSVPWEV